MLKVICFYGVDEKLAGQLNFLAKAALLSLLLPSLLNFDPILQEKESLWYQNKKKVKRHTAAAVLQDNALQCDFRGSWKLKKRSGSTPALVFFSAWFAFVFWLLSALLAAAAIGIWLAQECFWPRCDQILPNYCLIWSQSQSYFCPHFGLISPLASSAVFSCRYPWLLSLVHFTTHLLQLDCSSLFILSALLTI